MVHFGVSEELGILTISLFVAGYCLGPLVSRPAPSHDRLHRVVLLEEKEC
jgi:hypothetical protein